MRIVRAKQLSVLIVLVYSPWFLFLAQVPSGFYVDEIPGVAHALCFLNGLTNYNGVSWPIMSPAFGDGYTTPPYLYSLSVWAGVFRSSVYTIRCFSVVCILVTILFLCLIAKRLNIGDLYWVAIFSGTLPWAFHFSRIAWDAVMAPMFFAIGLYFSLKDNVRTFTFVLSGAFYALAMIAYPPFRLAVPAFLILFFVIRQWGPRRYLVQTLSLLVVFSPVLELTMTGEIQERFNDLSIYGHDARNPFADQNVLMKSCHFILNIGAHFDPRFLFINGDSNVRHSPSFSGMLSYVIGLVLLLFIARLCLRGIQRFDKTPFLLISAGLISFTVPAALMWEGVPHSLRSIGAWPFWVLLSAACLKQMPRLLPSYLICIIVIEGTAFHYNYLTKYAKESPEPGFPFWPWYGHRIHPRCAEYHVFSR